MCNYRNPFLQKPFEDRQKHLFKQYGFECDCAACVNNYPTQKCSCETKFNDVEHGTEILQNIDKTWGEIEKNFEKQTSLQSRSAYCSKQKSSREFCITIYDVMKNL